jgi:inorganic pyrophosphatase
MKKQDDQTFWATLTSLVITHRIIIDRPKGRPHPNWPPQRIYPLDYGYLERTSASDGSGIDVWLGSLPTKMLSGILCTFDTLKRDAEIKLLLGCTLSDVESILAFYSENMKALYILNPEEKNESNSPIASRSAQG